MYQKKCVFFNIIRRKTMKSESEKFSIIYIYLLTEEYAYQSSFEKINN